MTFEEVLRLIPLAHPDPDELITGATERDLASLDQILGFDPPPELTEWLSVCRGSTAGPGNLYGVGNDHDWLNISDLYRTLPEFRAKRWIPVAGDGAGNFYVLDASLPTHPVGFVESIDGTEIIQFYVASGLLLFLREILTVEVSRTGWPFDRDYVKRVDPSLTLYPLPWTGE